MIHEIEFLSKDLASQGHIKVKGTRHSALILKLIARRRLQRDVVNLG
jgi:hypothetical protein